MQTNKKQKTKYYPNVEGFRKDKLKECGLQIHMKHLCLLKHLIIINNTYKLNTLGNRKKRFVWINYKLIFDRFEGTKYTMRMLQNDLNILEKHELIEKFVENYTGKSMVYFHITEKSRDLYIYEIK